MAASSSPVVRHELSMCDPVFMSQFQASSPWVVLAHLLRPQGRKGEILAELLTDFPERFADRKRVFLLAPAKPATRTTPPPAPAEYTVEDHWLPMGKNAGRIVLKLTGIDSINDAELLKGFDVVIPRAERTPLEQDAAYIEDLIGCTLFNGADEVGTVEDVEMTAAADPGLPATAPLLIVRGHNGEEMLVPFAKAWLLKLDAENKRIDMTLPPGLLTINAPLTATDENEAVEDDDHEN